MCTGVQGRRQWPSLLANFELLIGRTVEADTLVFHMVSEHAGISKQISKQA
jgi:hypothetical protein